MSSLSRREALGRLAAGGAAFAFMPPTLARTTASFTAAFSWISDVQYVGYYMGIDNGHFSHNGLDANFVAGGPNKPPALVSLAAGQADLAFANWEQFVQASSKGNDLVAIGAQFPVNPVGILSLSPFNGMEDLLGKRFLLPTATDVRLIDVLFRLSGFEPNYTAVPTGFSPAPLLAGDGDAYFCYMINQPITFERMGMKNGKDFHVVGIGELGYKIPNQFLVTNRAKLEADRAKYVSFLRGFTAGWLDNINNPAAGVATTLDRYGSSLGLDGDHQDRQNELQIPLLYGKNTDKLFWFDLDTFTATASRVAEVGNYEFLPDIATSIDLSLLAEAQS